MSDRSIARLIQKYAGVGWGSIPRRWGPFAQGRVPHRGLRAGATIAKMQEVSRHKKVEVLLGYVRSAELFDDHAGERFL
jgi:hypothetical protein